MKQETTFLFDAPPAGDERSWVQVAKTGRFKDPRYGVFKITLDDFKRWIANFSSLSLTDGRLGLPVDVDHSPEKRGETEAVGWVKQLEVRNTDELWGLVDWNSEGKALVADRRYAYISPSYSPDFKDETGRSHGTAMVGIALTNRPFLQMATVNLSKFTFASDYPAQHKPKGDNDGDDEGLDADQVTDLDDGDVDMDDIDMDEIEGMKYSASKPHPLDDVMLNISDATRQKHAVVVKKIDGETKHMFPIPPGDKVHARAALSLLPKATKAGHITEEEAAAVRSRARGVLGDDGDSDDAKQHSSTPYSPSQMELTQVLTALKLSRSDLGVAEDADEAVVLAAIAKHQEPAAGVVTLSQDEVAKLTAQAAAGESAAEELRVAKFNGAFELAQGEGKITLGQKDAWREMYDVNGEKTLKLLSELKPVINMAPQGAGGTGADLDESARALSSEFQDTVTPLAIDGDSARLHAAAIAIEREKNVPYEQALQLAEAAA